MLVQQAAVSRPQQLVMALLGVILTMCALLSSVAGSTCSFEYIRQPPSTTMDGCNPYTGSSNAVSISLECTIRIREMVTDEFVVRWFRENTVGAVEDLGLGDPNVMLGSMDWFSRYHNTEFRNQPYSPSLLGKYWCQVINTTADPDQPLMRSNVFTLLAPGDYNGAICTTQSQFVDIRTCADLPDQPVVALTTTTVPVLVPSSTTMTQISTIFTEPSTTTQLTANTASLTSKQTISVTSILPSITTDNAVATIDNAVTTIDSAVTTTDSALTTILPSITTDSAVITTDSAVTTILPSITAVVNVPTSVTNDNAVTTSALTPAASSPSTSPQLDSQEEQVSPFLYVIASIGGIFLITIIILTVVIFVMLLKKNQSGQKEVGLDNEAYGLNEGIPVQGAYTAKPEMKSFQNSVKDSPEDYAEPVLTLQRSGYPAPSAANGGRNMYSSVDTPTQHMVNHHYDPSIPQDNGYSCLQHDTSPPPPTSSPYSKLGHSHTNNNANLPVTAVYSTLEDSNAPVYNTLEGTDDDYEDPDYSNIGPEEDGAVRPHYVEEYDRAVNYHPPSTANPLKNGRHPPHH